MFARWLVWHTRGAKTHGQTPRQRLQTAHFICVRSMQLLMEHILPLASRRRPTSIAAALSDPLVRDLLRHYGPALRELFRCGSVRVIEPFHLAVKHVPVRGFSIPDLVALSAFVRVMLYTRALTRSRRSHLLHPSVGSPKQVLRGIPFGCCKKVTSQWQQQHQRRK